MLARACTLVLGLVAFGAAVACSVLVDSTGLTGGRRGDASATSDSRVGDDASLADAGRCDGCADATPCDGAACLSKDRLVAWWTFEDAGAKVTDVSGNGNDGLAYHATFVDGKVGAGMRGEYGACVLVPDSPSLRLNGASALTMMAWISAETCPLEPDASVDHEIVLNKENTYEIGIRCSPVTLQEALNTSAWDWHGSTALPQSTWHHVAVTWDGATVRHYLDGAQTDSHAQSGALATVGSGLGIGCRDVTASGAPGSLREWFAGRIDEVMVYARALSQAEIAAYVQITK